ncbi:MAG: HesA/MoeB/ThiF family protein [Eubacteriaceae bacterium]|nr:HesA/MoeB/ThiF family protein [Eubacteriaceae bacterium]
MDFSRYVRQMNLDGFGIEGQRRLSSAQIAVIGAGGLGSPALYYLVSAGIGSITIVDNDEVSLTNLNRQFLHFEDDIGFAKAESAANKLTLYNSQVSIAACIDWLDEANVHEYVDGYSAVVACVDNKKTRYLLNSACVQANVPFFDAGIDGFDGYTLTVLPGLTACYKCIFPNEPASSGTSPSVLGATAGAVGSIQAMQVIKHLAGLDINSYFHYIDLVDYRITNIHAQRDPACPVCAGNA